MNVVNIRGDKRVGKITATTSLQLLLPANVHRIEVRFKNIASSNPVYLSNGKIELMDTTAAALSASGTTLTNTTASVLAVNDVVRLEDEFVLVTACPTSTTSTITRGYLNTTAVAHATGLTLYASRTHAAANADYGYKLASGTELIDLSSNDAWYVLSTGGNADVEYVVITK
jgi:hypothetical protein